MKEYKNIAEYCRQEGNPSIEELKSQILRSSLEMLVVCKRNFEGDAEMTEKVALPLYYFNDILDSVE